MFGAKLFREMIAQSQRNTEAASRASQANL